MKELLTETYFDQQYGKLSPVVKVSYLRSYYQLHAMRVTVDEKITYNDLQNDLKRTFVDPELVSEVKTLMSHSDDFLQRYFPSSSARFSKYSRAILFARGDLNEV